ncbi:MAG: putative rane protein, partial [Actinomycetospora sp.]|nr:putative rane protein [Actinomycetospora sp.]
MTSAREDAVAPGAVGPGERSVVRTVRGLRWWGALALAAVLTVAGVAVDLVASGELGVVFTACFAGGCILATAWARRDSLFVPLVQPP